MSGLVVIVNIECFLCWTLFHLHFQHSVFTLCSILVMICLLVAMLIPVVFLLNLLMLFTTVSFEGNTSIS